MGDLVKFSPKALVEFEETALAKIAGVSSAMLRVPAWIREARRANDNVVLASMDRVTYMLSALEEGVGLLEDIASQLIDVMGPHEVIRVETENLTPDWEVTFIASTRSKVLFVRDFAVRQNTPIVRIDAAAARALKVSRVWNE